MIAATSATWKVRVTNHALRRWRKRYGHFDSDDAIREALARRVVAGIRETYGLQHSKARNLRRFFLSQQSAKREEHGKVEYGDLTVVYHRNGMDVVVITVY